MRRTFVVMDEEQLRCAQRVLRTRSVEEEATEMIITLQKRNMLELPRELRRALKLEPGASLEVHLEHGRLVLTPVALGPPTLHLTETGKAKEAEADAEIRQGATSSFQKVEELIEDLEG